MRQIEVEASITLEIPDGDLAEDHAKRMIDAINRLAMSEEQCLAWEASWEPEP